MKANIITLTTDFGLKDPYQGAMKGSILSVNPTANIIDITHLVPPGNIIEGSLVLKDAFSCFPEGTVHVGVVDPGVGGKRRPIIIETGRYLFVGPDNGLFSGAVEKENVLRIIHLTNKAFFLKDQSSTFHGRDIFAPVAASLSLGADPGEFGEQVARIEELYAAPALRVEGLITGSVIFVDSFGNLITNINGDEVRSLDARAVEVTIRGQHLDGVKKTYGDVVKGGLVALIGSSGRIEIAVNSGSASEAIEASVGERVTVRAKRGMRAVVQRVKSACVSVDGAVKGKIGQGLLAYIGVEKGDGKEDLDFIASKIMNLRVFEDPDGRMNLDVREAKGALLLISKFTLLADCRKGRRPSFDRAEPPGPAKEAYGRLVESLKHTGIRVETGEFQAHMEVESVNDGPITLLLDSRKGF